MTTPTKTHCPHCGLPGAVQAVEGERSILFECKACGSAHEQDRPHLEPAVVFETQARYQGRLFEMRGHPA